MLGNVILLTPQRATREEGFIAAGETPKPGTVMQRQQATALVGNRYTYEIYNADADGGRPKGPWFILDMDMYLGKTATDAYAAGARCILFCPHQHCEFNGLVANIAGTGDDHVKGEMLIVDDTTGKFIATTGSPETEVAQLNETITDPTADTLAWMTWQQT